MTDWYPWLVWASVWLGAVTVFLLIWRAMPFKDETPEPVASGDREPPPLATGHAPASHVMTISHQISPLTRVFMNVSVSDCEQARREYDEAATEYAFFETTYGEHHRWLM